MIVSNLLNEKSNKLDMKIALKHYDMSNLLKASQEYKDYFTSNEYLEKQKNFEIEMDKLILESRALIQLAKEINSNVDIEALNQKSREAKNIVLGIDLDLDKDVKSSSLKEELETFTTKNHETLEDELKKLSLVMKSIKQEKELKNSDFNFKGLK